MSIYPFSPAGRQAALDRMEREQFDLLVVGGGITGCTLARDATLRGLQVALVEKEDFGYGTSSRSSKLVHGGLRYLAQGDIRVTRESAVERKVLRRIAPHLVHPLSWYIPMYKGEHTAFIRTGLILFDQLAGNTEDEKHRVLKPEDILAVAPGLRGPVTGGFVYGEYITEDARLTMEHALDAALRGAAVANHVRLTAIRRQGDRVVGAEVEDTLTGRKISIDARVVVNATGPWAEKIMLEQNFKTPKPMLISKGIHLLFSASRIPIEGAVYLKGFEGREGFAIRRWDYVYVGTTDVPYDGPIDRPLADRAALEHVLKMAQECFPEAGLTEADILCTWAGVRPLILEPGKSARETSRHDEVWKIADGLLTVAGGKLTTARRMAARIMDQVARELGRSLGDNRRTAEELLPNAHLDGQDFESCRAELAAALERRGVAPEAVRRITWMYGTAIRELLRYGDEDPAWLAPLGPGVPAIRGEVRLAVEREMALTLEDFMDRRAALLIFSPDHGLAGVEEAARVMGDLLGWDEAERNRQVEAYRMLARQHDAASVSRS
ncbi:MAG TPA: glycerol-3-phosphate dehydrogenase/oxidase [Symbiobacteriaceae bacterium]